MPKVVAIDLNESAVDLRISERTSSQYGQHSKTDHLFVRENCKHSISYEVLRKVKNEVRALPVPVDE